MFKQPLTYVDLDGNVVTKDFYFNLTKAEIKKIDLSLHGGFEGFMTAIENDPNVNDMLEVIDKLILAAYGKRTVDNKFIKSKELSEEFAASDAYSELFMMLISDENDYINKFLRGVINVTPEEMKKIFAENKHVALEPLKQDI